MKRFYSDTETTGTDPKRHGLIQFTGIVTIDGVEKGRINLQITPFEGDLIEDDALEHNGITREELNSLDRMSPKQAVQAINDFLGQWVDKFDKFDKYQWYGYKAAFDSDFTREFFYKNGDKYFGSWFFTPPLCVMTLAAYILQKERQQIENMKLRSVYGYLFPHRSQMYTEEEWHDALFDIERTMDVEKALRKRVGLLLKSNKEAEALASR